MSSQSSADQIKNWSTQQVLQWVSSLPTLTEAEVDVFRENEIDGEDLLLLTKNALRDDLRLSRLKARNIVISAIAELQSNAPPTGTAGARVWYVGATCVLVAIVGCCYANAVDGGWQVDDPRSFAGNRDVVGQLEGGDTDAMTPGVRGDPYLPSSGLQLGQTPPSGAQLRQGPLARLLHDDFWGEPMSSTNSHKSYRPLTVLSFRISYHAFNFTAEPSAVRLYHAENICWHSLVVVLTLFVARKIPGASQNIEFAFGSAALFAVHAIHTEAVTNVTGRAELLCAVLFLCSFLAYPDEHNYRMCIGRVVLATFLGLAAMLAKEQGVTILGVNAIVDVLRNWPLGRASTAWRFCVRSIVVTVLAVPALLLRLRLNNGQEPRFSDGVNPASVAPEVLTRFMTYPYVWARSYWLLFWPASLSADWGYGSIPVLERVADARNMVTLGFFMTVAGIICWCLQRYPIKFILTWVAFLFLPFLPASNIFFRVGFVIAERVMYLPSLGFCFFVASLCFWKHKLQPVGIVWLRYGIFLAIILAHGMRTYQRNSDWSDCRMLWDSSSIANPSNEFLPYARGSCALQRSDEGSVVAEGFFRKSLQINPAYGSAAVQLAKILHAERLFAEEEALLTGTLAYSSVRSQLREWRELMLQLGELRESRGSAEGNTTALQLGFDIASQVLARFPDTSRAHMVQGNVYYRAGKLDQARHAYNEVLRLDPHHIGALNNMAAVIVQKEPAGVSEAIAIYEQALTLEAGQRDPALLNSYGAVLCKFPNRFGEARMSFEAALKIDPKFSTAKAGLQWLLSRDQK